MRAKDSRAPFVLLSGRTFGFCSSAARPALVHSNKAMPTGFAFKLRFDHKVSDLPIKSIFV